MIALLNISVTVVVVTLLYLAWRFKSIIPVGIAIILVLAHGQFQPSYGPKGVVHKASFVAPEEREVTPMRDLIPKAQTGEERDAKRNTEYQKTDERIEKLIGTNPQ